MQILLLVLLITAMGLAVLGATLSKRLEDSLYRDYQDALSSGDAERALLAARAYYVCKRQGQLTPVDEQRIAHDLARMNAC